MNHDQLDVLVVRHNYSRFRSKCTFDVYDPDSMEILLTGDEEKISILNSFFRANGFAVDLKMNIINATGEVVYTLVKDTTFFKTMFYVLDGQNVRIANFQKSNTTNDIAICNDDDEPIAFLNREGILKRSYHVLLPGQHHVASIAAKNLSSFKEFSWRDNTFAIEVDEGLPQDHFLRKLLIPAVVYINWF